MDAVILLNKPAGMTSFDAVRACRRIYHEKKTGHTGTLDPNATGLMIVLLGRYTKLVPYCLSDHKKYKAEFRMGIRTDTEDIWGEQIESRKPQKEYTDAELAQAAVPFTGDILQVPPMYSALKKDGKKLYEYARKGQIVEREPRKVTVNRLEVHHLHDDLYSMDAQVSSGTYVRTLIADYCASFGEIGTMTSLVRYGIDKLSLSDACTLEELKAGKESFLSPLKVIDPSWKLVACRMPEMVKSGRHVYLKNETSDKVIFVKDGQLLAAYRKEEDDMYHCVRGLL